MKFFQSLEQLDALYYHTGSVNHEIGSKFIQLMKSFYVVIQSCFGKTVSPDYKDMISAFCSEYKILGISVTVEVHLHVEPYHTLY